VVYLPEGFAPNGVPLSENFYLVWMYGGPEGDPLWRIDLRNAFGDPIATDLPVRVQIVPPGTLRSTFQDIAIAYEPGWLVPTYRTEIHLSFLCANGLHLQKAPVWYRDFPR
jgi:hypothetical protein